MKILVTDVWSVYNAGDAAILDALLVGLGQQFPTAEISVCAHLPDGCQAIANVEVVADVLAFDEAEYRRQRLAEPGSDIALDRLRSMYQSADLVVSTGGYFLNAVPANAFAWVFLSRLLHMGWALDAGIPVTIVGQSIGPIEGAELRAAAQATFARLAYIGVRDVESYSFLHRTGLAPRAELTADLAVALEPAASDIIDAALHRNGIARDTFAISVRTYPGTPDTFFADVARVADRVVQTYDLDVLLIGTTAPPGDVADVRRRERALGNDDTLALHAVRKLMVERGRAQVCTESLPPRVLQGVLGTCRAFLGTRMHASILATTSGVPSAGIGYEFKVRGWYERLGMGDLVVPLAEATEANLWSLAQRIIDDGADLRNRLVDAMPTMRAASAANFDGIVAAATSVPAAAPGAPMLSEGVAARPVDATVARLPRSASVIVPVFNRLDLLEPVVRAMANQTVDAPHEIVFIDDGSDVPVAPLIEAIGTDQMTVFRQQNQGRGAAINAGIAQSTGDLVIICDSDIVPTPAWLSQHLAFHETNPNEASTHLGALEWGTTNGPIGELMGARANPELIGRTGPLDWTLWYTDNWSCKRSFLERHDLRFDPAYAAWGWEELALGHAMASAGATNVLTEAAMGRHVKPISSAAMLTNFERSVPNLVRLVAAVGLEATNRGWLDFGYRSHDALDLSGRILDACLGALEGAWRALSNAPEPLLAALAQTSSDAMFGVGLGRGFAALDHEALASLPMRFVGDDNLVVRHANLAGSAIVAALSVGDEATSLGLTEAIAALLTSYGDGDLAQQFERRVRVHAEALLASTTNVLAKV